MPVKSSESHIVKYRPALTLDQISHIASVLQTDMNDPISKSIIRVLVPLLAKINNKLIEPAYALSAPTVELTIVKEVIKENKTIERNEQYRYEHDLMSQQEQDVYEAKILGIL